jgi:exodeoxyribonuclease VII small subunit
MEEKSLTEVSFEEAMGELESLVRRLEEGRFPLEEAIQVYERGTALRKHCEAKLKAAQMKVEQIMISAEGTVETKPFGND